MTHCTVLILQESPTLDSLPASQLLTNWILQMCEYFFIARVYTATVSASGLFQSGCPALIPTLFTESALRPIQSSSCDVRVCVCVSIPSQLFVDYAQTVRVSVFCHKTDCIYISL